MKESFVFYDSFLEALDELDSENELLIYRAISHYALRGEVPELKGIAKAVFALIKPQIDANNKRYDDYQKAIENGKKGAIYGSLGGRPKKNNPPQKPPKNPPGVILKNPINVNDNVNVNVNDNVIHLPLKDELDEIPNLKNWYGEYKNVHLTDEQFKNLQKIIIEPTFLESIINDLSENIALKKDKSPPYDENFPDMHFIAIKKYHDYRRLNPSKFKPPTKEKSTKDILKEIETREANWT